MKYKDIQEGAISNRIPRITPLGYLLSNSNSDAREYMQKLYFDTLLRHLEEFSKVSNLILGFKILKHLFIYSFISRNLKINLIKNYIKKYNCAILS